MLKTDLYSAIKSEDSEAQRYMAKLTMTVAFVKLSVDRVPAFWRYL